MKELTDYGMGVQSSGHFRNSASERLTALQQPTTLPATTYPYLLGADIIKSHSYIVGIPR